MLNLISESKCVRHMLDLNYAVFLLIKIENNKIIDMSGQLGQSCRIKDSLDSLHSMGGFSLFTSTNELHDSTDIMPALLKCKKGSLKL